MKKILFIALTTIALTACSKDANKQTETKPTTEDKSVTAQTNGSRANA
ncbi:membrane lipoprotein lipid attachment site-containing protein [Acinetobacter sp. NRRL B-65365]|nr:membrane lipoprotein lipid attachment site-containing protein [Acinetobacter sp. NRRL B-65365]